MEKNSQSAGIILTCSLILFSIVPFSAAHALEAALSHSVYYLPDPIYNGNLNPYVEAYWQVNPKTVHYNTNENKGIIARIQTDVVIFGGKGNVVKEDHYIYQTVPRTTPDELATMNILELKRYLITPGNFKMKLKLTDLNDTSNSLTIIDSFDIANVPAMPFFGSLELIDTFYESDVKTPFRKHGKQFIPLCQPFFDDYRNSLSFYTETYRLEKVQKSDYPLLRSVYISKKENEGAYGKYIKLDTLLDDKTPFHSGVFNIDNLPSGNYYLNVSLGNKLHQTLSTQSIFFQRLNKHEKKEVKESQAASLDTGMQNVQVLDLSKTFIAKYNLPQIQAMLKMLLPVSDPASTRSIEGFIKKPDELYIRYFIYNYFLSVNKDKPEQAWKAYSERVKEANKLYSVGGRIGYETPRGFMFLRYGAPSEVINSQSEKGSLPYEIWQYNILKEMDGKQSANALILFYKSSENDFDYKILHTTIAGEPHNAAWRTFLFKAAGDASNGDSRAEQYIGNR